MRQALVAGVIDELTLDVAPVLLGSGERIFDGVESFGFEPVEVLHSPLPTHPLPPHQLNSGWRWAEWSHEHPGHPDASLRRHRADRRPLRRARLHGHLPADEAEPDLVLEGHGFPLHYYGMKGHRAEDSHSTCGVVVADTEPLFQAFAAGLTAHCGKLPLTGLPRITRPRPRKNAGGLSGFSLIDPGGQLDPHLPRGNGGAGRRRPFTASGESAQRHRHSRQQGLPGPGRQDSQGAVRRAHPADPALPDAVEFLDQLKARLS